MKTLDASPQNTDRIDQAAQALEATLLRQLIGASGAFRGNDVAGSKLHADMFVEVLADAVARGDGLGLVRVLTRSLPDGAAAEELAPALGPQLRTDKDKKDKRERGGRRAGPFGESGEATEVDPGHRAGTPFAPMRALNAYGVRVETPIEGLSVRHLP
jgi:Rod binding domain-containing protein